jgi:hypothetical protein
MSPRVRRAALPALLTACAALLAARPAVACPFCNAQGQTLTADAAQASMILFGRLTNARLDPNDVNSGTTDLEIEAVVKPHEILAGRKVLTLKRYLPLGKENKFLVFCDVYKGQIDPYRGEAVQPDSRIAEYLKGALAVKDKDTAAKLHYFFTYLDDKDVIVSNDAYSEFGNADYKDFRAVAEKAPADKVAGWLRDQNTPPSRLGLYGSVLGHCGKPEHAKLLRGLLDDPQRRFASGIDGMLAGYVQLQPKEGWAYITGLLRDPQKDFLLRYAALRAARFFHDFRPDVVPAADVTAAVVALLDQKDIADLAIEDLRKWSCWDVADKVLGLYGRDSHNVPIIRRAIVRYALNCPAAACPKAAPFVAARRKEDAKWVEEVEELLRLESARPAAAATPATASAAPPAPKK